MPGEELVARIGASRRNEIADKRAAELHAEAFTVGDKTLRYFRRDFGQASEGQRSLWISMHGGGGTTELCNDEQWRNQCRLYEPEEGIYIAPRAPTNTWNLWHQDHIDDLFDRLIETFIATQGVSPNRVYLLGYSAGGDGVYQLAPRMADRFAAASMMAGHPNDADPCTLRNLPFAIFVGGQDSRYDRNVVAKRWGDQLAELRDKDPEGYVHRCTVYEDLGHWMMRCDAEGLSWMAQFTRDPWPKKVVWRQAGRLHSRFYWLAVPEEHRRQGTTIVAAVENQTIRITKERTQPCTLRLSDRLLDLDQPVTVIINGVVRAPETVSRTRDAIRTSLAERFDLESAATALLHLA